MSDKELVQICLQQVRIQLNYEASGPLRQRDLEHISGDIEGKTGILISISTIKRLMNGQFNQLPQAATLNAITKYIGYEGWQDFRVKQNEPTNGRTEIVVDHRSQPPVHPPVQKKTSRYSRMVALLVGVPIVLVATVSFFARDGSINPEDVSFSVKKVTSNDIPNTVIFTYDLGNVSGDSFFIQQSWDRDRRVKIDKGKHTLTDIYYEPGYHNAKLIVNNTVVKSIDISIPTNGWFFYMQPELFKGSPTYIHPIQPIDSGILSLRPEDISNSRIDPSVDNFYTYAYFPEKYDVGSDNFKFNMRFKLNELKNVTCPTIMHEICGQSNAIYFFTTLPGCTGNINANIGEHFLSGKTTDLSGFGCNIREWHDLAVIVNDKHARFFIDEREIFNKSFTTTAGLITGMIFSSNGLLEIEHISLKGLDGSLVYEHDFEP